MKHDLPVFALLIDADNVTKEAIAPIIEEVTRHGWIAVRRVYGDFTTPHLAGWRETLASLGIHPVQQYRNSVGKNSSDIALVIEAMDLLHSGRFEGFCLVSSDGDFTRLATRIREDGLSVFGFGRKDAAKAFVNACERYIYIENLLSSSEMPKEVAPPVKDELPPKPTVAFEAPKPSATDTAKGPAVRSTSRGDKEKLKKLLSRAYTNVAEDNGWALVSRIDQYLRANHSDFDPRNYGAGTFPKLLAALDIFEITQRKQGNGTAQVCRPREGRLNLGKAAPPAYINALKAAVASSKSADGWANISKIFIHLHEHDHLLENSGYASLSNDLLASGLFDMRDAGGTQKDFRFNTTVSSG